MDELEQRSRERFVLGVAEAHLECRVDALEVAVEARHDDEVGRDGEETIDLGRRLRPSCGGHLERARECREHEAGSEDDPLQGLGRTVDRSPRHQHVEALSRRRERAAHRPCAAERSGRRAADREPQGRRVARGRPQPRPLDEQREEPRFDDPLVDALSRLHQEKPPRTVSQRRERRRRRVIQRARPGDRGSDPRLDAQIEAGHDHRREARDEGRRQIGRPRSDGHCSASLIQGHDRVADPQLVRGAPGGWNLLDPGGGRYTGWAQPARGDVLELGAPGPAHWGTGHEPAQTFEQCGCLLDAAVDLGGGDFGTALGIVSRVTLAECAGAEKTCHGKREHQRHGSDLSQTHAPAFLRRPDHCARGERA
jgi:hypothetical protein